MSALLRSLQVLFLLLAATPSGLLAQTSPNRIFIEDQLVRPGDKGFVVPVRMDTDQERQGFTIALRYDPAVLRLVTAEPAGAAKPLVDLAGTVSEGAEWSDGRIVPAEGKACWGVVLGLSSSSGKAIPAGRGQVLLKLSFDAIASGPTKTTIDLLGGAGGEPGRWTTLLASRSVPPTRPELVSGTITIGDPPPPNPFLRGDCNGDHGIDISDPIGALEFLFRGNEGPPCFAACDGNADGTFDVSDAIFLLLHLYGGGMPIKPPFPGCDQAAPQLCGAATCATTP
jgi:hypothetical protein